MLPTATLHDRQVTKAPNHDFHGIRPITAAHPASVVHWFLRPRSSCSYSDACACWACTASPTVRHGRTQCRGRGNRALSRGGCRSCRHYSASSHILARSASITVAGIVEWFCNSPAGISTGSIGGCHGIRCRSAPIIRSSCTWPCATLQLTAVGPRCVAASTSTDRRPRTTVRRGAANARAAISSRRASSSRAASAS